MKSILLASLLLSGCLTLPHKVEIVQIDGRAVEVHTDAPASIEPDCGDSWAGCYKFGKVWLRSPVSQHTVDHEFAHAAKPAMEHGPWVRHPVIPMVCAVVLVAGGKYRLGEAICVDRSGERVVNASVFGG